MVKRLIKQANIMREKNKNHIEKPQKNPHYRNKHSLNLPLFDNNIKKGTKNQFEIANWNNNCKIHYRKDHKINNSINTKPYHNHFLIKNRASLPQQQWEPKNKVNIKRRSNRN